MAIQSDGKIMVVGEASIGSNYDFIVARYLGSNAPKAMTLAGISMNQAPGQVRVSWQTEQEIDLLRFNLYRSSEPGGARQRLNQTLIAAQVTGGLQGAAYEYADTDLAPGRAYKFWLEVVSLEGNQVFGPASAVGYHWVRSYTVQGKLEGIWAVKTDGCSLDTSG